MIKLFDFVVNTNTSQFVNWIYSELPKDEESQALQWEDEPITDKKEGIISVNGYFIPPGDIDNPHPLYILDFDVPELGESDSWPKVKSYKVEFEIREVLRDRTLFLRKNSRF